MRVVHAWGKAQMVLASLDDEGWTAHPAMV